MPASRARRLSALGWLAVILLGLLLAAGTGEVIARWREGTLSGERKVYLRADPLLGWANVPNLDYRIENSEYRSVVRTDANGFIGPPRTPARSSASRIVAVGDSFTAGMAVNEPDRFVTLIERDLSARLGPTEVVNTGVVGYQTDQEVLAYEERGRAFRPDLVLLFVYPNDVMGNVSRDGDLTIEARKPTFRLEGDRLVLQPINLEGLSEGLWGYLNPRPAGFVEGAKVVLYQGSALYRLAADMWFRLRHPTPATAPTGASASAAPAVPAADLVYRRSPSPDVEAAWRLEAALLRRLRDDATADGARFGIVVIPELKQAVPGAWDEFVRSHGLDASAWDAGLPQRRLAEVCAAEGFSCLDVLGALRPIPSAYYPLDLHLTPAGHRAVADAVTPWLIERRLVGSR